MDKQKQIRQPLLKTQQKYQYQEKFVSLMDPFVLQDEQCREDQDHQVAAFSYQKFLISMVYWHVAMFIGPLLQLPYDIKLKCQRANAQQSQQKLYQEINPDEPAAPAQQIDRNKFKALSYSWGTILKRTFIHLLFLLVQWSSWLTIKSWEQKTKNQPETLQQFLQFLIESQTLLVYFPLLLLAMVMSTDYADFNQGEYHQRRYERMLTNLKDDFNNINQQWEFIQVQVVDDVQVALDEKLSAQQAYDSSSLLSLQRNKYLNQTFKKIEIDSTLFFLEFLGDLPQDLQDQIEPKETITYKLNQKYDVCQLNLNHEFDKLIGEKSEVISGDDMSCCISISDRIIEQQELRTWYQNLLPYILALITILCQYRFFKTNVTSKSFLAFLFLIYYKFFNNLFNQIVIYAIKANCLQEITGMLPSTSDDIQIADLKIIPKLLKQVPVDEAPLDEVPVDEAPVDVAPVDEPPVNPATQEYMLQQNWQQQWFAAKPIDYDVTVEFKPIEGCNFPPINFTNIYSLKAHGQLKLLFFNHWELETVRANMSVAFFSAICVVFVYLMQMRKQSALELAQTSVVMDSVIVMLWFIILLFSIGTYTLYTIAQVNNIYLQILTELNSTRLQISELQVRFFTPPVRLQPQPETWLQQVCYKKLQNEYDENKQRPETFIDFATKRINDILMQIDYQIALVSYEQVNKLQSLCGIAITMTLLWAQIGLVTAFIFQMYLTIILGFLGINTG